MAKYKKISFTDKVLQHLTETSENIFDLGFMIIFEPHKMPHSPSLYKNYGRSYYNKIYHLKNSPYFTVKEDKIYVSDKGRMKIVKNLIQENKLKAWDGRWRAVIFDILEAKRKERNFLRGELKWMGFKELQHSIWITPYNIEKELLFLLKLWQKDLKGDVRFLSIEKIINDTDLRKNFNLPILPSPPN